MVWLIIDACSFVGKKVQKAGPGGKRKPQCGPERIAFHHEQHDIYIEIQERRPGRRHTMLTFLYFFWQCRCLEEETTTFVRFYEAQLLFHSLAFVFKPLLLFSNARKKLDLDYTNHLTVEKKCVYQLSLVVWTELKCQKCKKTTTKPKQVIQVRRFFFDKSQGSTFFPFKLQERLVRYWGRWIIFFGIWSGYKNSWVYNSWVCKMDV